MRDLEKNTGFVIGIFAAIIVVCIWSGWVVVARSGVQADLSIWDLSVLRFVTASMIALPIALWKRVDLRSLFSPKTAIAALASGAFYVLLSFNGLRYSGAANAGIAINGFLPLATMVVIAVMLLKRPKIYEIIIAAILLIANSLLLDSGALAPIAFFFFIAASFSLAFYMVVVRHWSLDPVRLFYAIPIVNAVFVVPFWLLLDRDLTAPIESILLQASYQGILVSLGGVTLFTFAVRRIGSLATSIVLAAVPTGTAILAFFFLNERLTTIQLYVLVVTTIAIIAHVWLARRSKPDER